MDGILLSEGVTTSDSKIGGSFQWPKLLSLATAENRLNNVLVLFDSFLSCPHYYSTLDPWYSACSMECLSSTVDSPLPNRLIHRAMGSG